VSIATPAPLGHHVVGFLGVSRFVRVHGSTYSVHTITVELPPVVWEGGTQVQNTTVKDGFIAATEIRKTIVFLLDQG
jgi:hypothetical protein